MAIVAIDYSALTEPVSRADVGAFRDAERGNPRYTPDQNVIVQVVVVVAIVATFGSALLVFLGTGVTMAVNAIRDGETFGIFTLVVPLVVVGGFGLAFFGTAKAMLEGGAQWERWYRLDRFATSNGLSFAHVDPNPQYPGAIFGLGRARTAVDHVRSTNGRFLDYGNYRYLTGSGRDTRTRTWGFLALQLDRALPNMVLDSRANNGLFGSTNLPAAFDKNQVLHLEGDFDQYFTLYCPREYEQDALYVFTPDLMALLIDKAAPFDVEIIDKWMFVYSNTPFDMAQPTIHQRLLHIVDTVGAKTLSQTDRYSDGRVQDFAVNSVFTGGQRLKRRASVGAIIISAVFIAIWSLPWIAQLVRSATER